MFLKCLGVKKDTKKQSLEYDGAPSENTALVPLPPPQLYPVRLNVHPNHPYTMVCAALLT